MSEETLANVPKLSAFSQKLKENPKLRSSCEQVAKAVREAAADEVKACIRSEQIGPDDLKIFIST